MVGGVNELSTRLAVHPVASARGEIGIPREPISNAPKHGIPALDLRRKPGLNGTPLHGWPERTGRPTLPHVCAAGHAFGCPFRNPQRGDAGGGAIFPAVPADKSDQPGVLGNLPRSRPGQRSEKRRGSRPATAAKPAAARSGAATKRKAATARKRAEARKPSPARRRATTSSTARTAAAQTAAAVAG